MVYHEFKKEEIMEVDLHKMKIWDVWNYLEYFVNNAPNNIKEIIVIHGYHGGTALLDMVRNHYKHRRIKKKFLSLNQGITSFILC